MTAARERHVKHVPTITDTHATEERYFPRGPCRDVIIKGRKSRIWRRAAVQRALEQGSR
jgi:hypothetical protein